MLAAMGLQHLQQDVLWRVLDELDTAGRVTVACVNRGMYASVHAYAASGRWASMLVYKPSRQSCAALFCVARCTQLRVLCKSPDDAEVLLTSIRAVAATCLKHLVLEIRGGPDDGGMDSVQTTFGPAICALKALESLEIRLGAVLHPCHITFRARDGDELCNLRRLVVTEAFPATEHSGGLTRFRGCYHGFSSYKGQPHVRNVCVDVSDHVAANMSQLTHVEAVVHQCNVLHQMALGYYSVQTLTYVTGAMPDEDNVYSTLDGRVARLDYLELCIDKMDENDFAGLMGALEWVDHLVLHVSDSDDVHIEGHLRATNVDLYLYSTGANRVRNVFLHHGVCEHAKTERLSIAAAPWTDFSIQPTSWRVHLPYIQNSAQLHDALRALCVDMSMVQLLSYEVAVL